MNFDAIFNNPKGRVSRAQFIPALLTVLAAIGFFTYAVTGRTAQFCVLVLMYPVFVLLAQRLRDMGMSIWLLLVPLALLLVSMAIELEYLSLHEAVDGLLAWVAVLVTAAYMLWGCFSNSKAAA